MAIRDHLDPKLKKRLERKSGAQPEQGYLHEKGKSAANKERNRTFSRAALALRLAIFLLAIVILDQSLGLSDSLFAPGEETADQIGTPNQNAQIAEDAFIQWIDEAVLIVVITAAIGALAGYLLALNRRRNSNSIVTMIHNIEETARDVTDPKHPSISDSNKPLDPPE